MFDNSSKKSEYEHFNMNVDIWAKNVIKFNNYIFIMINNIKKNH